MRVCYASISPAQRMGPKYARRQIAPASTGLTFYRDTDNIQENTLAEALSTLRKRSLGRLPERGKRSMKVLPGTRASRCRCPETGVGLDVGGLVKWEGQIEGGAQEAIRQALNLEVRAGL